MVIGKEISVFAPASVANVTCGFDILGFPLDGTGDKLVMKAIPEQTIKIRAIEGFDLPLDPDKNVVGVVIKKFMQDLNIKTGFELSIRKGVKPGSGMGSSAASAAAAAFAVNELAGKPLSTKELVKYAMVGEKLASGNAHADNVAPALLGNFVLIRSYAPLDIIQLKAPEELYCTVVHPHIQVKTEDSRMILKKQIPLKKAIESRKKAMAAQKKSERSQSSTTRIPLSGNPAVDALKLQLRSAELEAKQLKEEAALLKQKIETLPW